MRRTMGTLALGATMSVLAAIGAGCGVTPDEQATFEPTDAVPFDLLDGTASTTAPSLTSTGVATRICLVGEAARLYPVQRNLPTGSSADGLIEALAAGPTTAERAYGLTSAIGDAEIVSAIDREAGVAIVDLDPAFADVPTEDQLEAVGQIVCTLTEQPGVGQVSFTIDDSPVEVPRGDGSSTSDPVSRRDFDELIVAG